MSGISSSFSGPCSKARRRRWNYETFREFISARNRLSTDGALAAERDQLRVRVRRAQAGSPSTRWTRPLMAAWPAASSDPKAKSQPASAAWVQQFLLFALFFAGLMLLHAPLLRLPYFWDEAGYYVPAARDLFLTGTLIPQSTPSNSHPPLVMAWLALGRRGFGYSTLVTRTAMLAVVGFLVLVFFLLSRVACHLPL